ncbi:MAG: NACHT domain-containing protein, partial [Cyanobacteria bacterium J06636_16]
MTEFEPLIGAAIAGMTGLIEKITQPNGHQPYPELKVDLVKSWQSDQAIQRYVRYYADRYGTLKRAYLQNSPAVLLDRINTTVQVLKRTSLSNASLISSSPSAVHRNSFNRFEFQDDSRRPGIEVANEQPYLVVWGSPQTGKSTFLREIGFKALQRVAITKASLASKVPQLQQKRYAHDCIPVMVELSQFNRPGITVKKLIVKAFEDCGFAKPQTFTELCLRRGRLLILLDDLDAVSPSTLPKAIADIENLVERYRENRFVIASRTSADIANALKRFQPVAIAPFSDNQMQQFIAHWLGRSHSLEAPIVRRCWEQLNSPDHAAAKALAQTPLLLILLCTVYTTFRGLPKNRHMLYGTVLTVLLRRGITLERYVADSSSEKLGVDLALALLAEIARDSFEEQQPWFQKHTVLSRIQQFQTSNDNTPNLSPGKIFREFEARQGILVRRAQGLYSFAHPAFQEYLTAKYFVDNRKVESLVSDRLTDR